MVLYHYVINIWVNKCYKYFDLRENIRFTEILFFSSVFTKFLLSFSYYFLEEVHATLWNKYCRYEFIIFPNILLYIYYIMPLRFTVSLKYKRTNLQQPIFILFDLILTWWRNRRRVYMCNDRNSRHSHFIRLV